MPPRLLAPADDPLANQDPINGFDLDGNCSAKTKKCAHLQEKNQKKKIQARLNSIRRTLRQGRQERQAKSRTTCGTYGGISITMPWEHEIEKVVGSIQDDLNSVFGKSCTEKGVTFGAIAGLSGGGKFVAKQSGTAIAEKIAGWFTDIGEGSAFVGGVFTFLGRTGVC